MLKRKIESRLLEWKNSPDRCPMVIKGPRRCGKTFSVMRFARENYRNVVYLNFAQHPEYGTIFEGSLDVNRLISLISSLFGERTAFTPHETVLVFDEVQDCPDARTSLKFFKEDGRFDVICTGSLLGVIGYGKQPRSIPVGHEQIVEMKPLDFEEFLWAVGVGDDTIDMLRDCLASETPVPKALHGMMNDLLLRYAAVGGMPEAVQSFVESGQLNSVLTIQRRIVSSYEADMLKYAADRDKPYIRDCFRSIPAQLSKENKKFRYSVIRKGATAAKFADCLQWMEDAGIIVRCHNLTLPELPLDGNSAPDVFRVYMGDVGLFVSTLPDGTVFDILRGDVHICGEAVCESLFADVFSKMGRKLYYYRKDSGLEIDFVMRYRGGCRLVEVKAVTGNTKSSKTVLSHPEKYHVDGLIKLGTGYNVGRDGNVLTLPAYLAFLLTEY